MKLTILKFIGLKVVEIGGGLGLIYLFSFLSPYFSQLVNDPKFLEIGWFLQGLVLMLLFLVLCLTIGILVWINWLLVKKK